jgi:hypothetical protein
VNAGIEQENVLIARSVKEFLRESKEIKRFNGTKVKRSRPKKYEINLNEDK